MSKVYLISGDDDFLRKKRARELAAELGGGDPDDPGFEVISGDSEERKADEIAADFVDAVRTPPFLSPHKLVWLRHFPDFELFYKKGACEAALQILCEEPPPNVDILVDTPGFDQRKSGAKAVKNAGVQIELYNNLKSFDRKFEENRRQLLENLFRSAGKQAEPRAMQYLLETIGGTAGNLVNEVEKLCLYTGDDPRITLNDCEMIVSRTQEAVSWDFSQAVSEGSRIKALKLLNVLFVKDGDAIPLLAAIGNEFQRFSQVRAAMAELGVARPGPHTFDDPRLKERYPENMLVKIHPFRAYKMCEGAMKFSGAELASKLSAIRDASMAVVSGTGDQKMILERLILKLTGTSIN